MAYPRSTHYLTALLRRELAHVRGWSPEASLQWVQWHCDNGLALVVRRGWRIAGAVLVRRVWSRDEAESYWAHSPDAPIAYIDCAVARGPGAFKALFNLFYAFIGHACTHMAWSRFKYNNRVTVLPMRDAFRRMVKYEQEATRAA